MTAPDPRLGEIADRLSRATPGPWEEHQDVVRIGFEEMEPLSVVKCVRTSGKTEVHYVAPWVNNEDDQTFIAAAPADVAYLLAELRKAQDALGRVEGLAAMWTSRGEHDMAYSKTIPDEDIAMELLTYGAGMVENARHIRNAVAAATGGES